MTENYQQICNHNLVLQHTKKFIYCLDCHKEWCMFFVCDMPKETIEEMHRLIRKASYHDVVRGLSQKELYYKYITVNPSTGPNDPGVTYKSTREAFYHLRVNGDWIKVFDSIINDTKIKIKNISQQGIIDDFLKTLEEEMKDDNKHS